MKSEKAILAVSLAANNTGNCTVYQAIRADNHASVLFSFCIDIN